MSNYILKLGEMAKQFSSTQIAYFADDFDGDQAAAVLYLWLFHHFSTSPEELKNNGRAMYKNLVQTLRPMIERLSRIEEQEQLEAQTKELRTI